MFGIFNIEFKKCIYICRIYTKVISRCKDDVLQKTFTPKVRCSFVLIPLYANNPDKIHCKSHTKIIREQAKMQIITLEELLRIIALVLRICGQDKYLSTNPLTWTLLRAKGKLLKLWTHSESGTSPIKCLLIRDILFMNYLYSSVSVVLLCCSSREGIFFAWVINLLFIWFNSSDLWAVHNSTAGWSVINPKNWISFSWSHCGQFLTSSSNSSHTF